LALIDKFTAHKWNLNRQLINRLSLLTSCAGHSGVSTSFQPKRGQGTSLRVPEKLPTKQPVALMR
jgi:hypothetical protein